MDTTRLLQLSGIYNTTLLKEYQDSVEELNLLEKLYSGKHNLNIETNTISVEEILHRMEAAKKALSITNRLTDVEYKRKHLSRVLSNMNTIRAAINNMIKQLRDY
jgi:hypothetical protein